MSEKMKINGEILSAIKLEDAFFCLDCEAVTNCSDVCPACGNRHLWSLQNWLGRVGDRGNGKFSTSLIEESQLATQEIATNRAEGAIVTSLLTLRKKLLCWVGMKDYYGHYGFREVRNSSPVGLSLSGRKITNSNQ